MFDGLLYITIKEAMPLSHAKGNTFPYISWQAPINDLLFILETRFFLPINSSPSVPNSKLF